MVNKTKEKSVSSLSEYNNYVNRKRGATAIAVALTLVAMVYAVSVGPTNMPIIDVIKTFMGMSDGTDSTVIFNIRLPRIITAVLVGASLAISGVVMQCVLANPLASASTLGVSQGAAFGAAMGIIVFGGGAVQTGGSTVLFQIDSPHIVTISAFVFGLISTVVILLIAQIKKNLGASALILAGVAVSSLFSGGSALLQYFADESQLGAVVFWTFGNLANTNWSEILLIFVVFAFSMIYFLMNRWNYNAMGSGIFVAKSLGVDTRMLMLVSMVICALVASVSVAFVGVISFVGLVAPHIMRKFVGNDFRFLLPGSAILGALLLVVADTFAREIIAPVVLPIGAITSFLGAPVFLGLLLKGGKRVD